MQIESSVLAFSINTQNANKDFVFAAIDRFREKCHFQDKCILVGDTIREHSYHVIDNYSKQAARKICLDIGNKFIKIIKDYFEEKSIPPFTIFRWDELMAEESYQALLSQAVSLIASDEHSMELLRTAALEFLTRRNPGRMWKPMDVEVCFNFLRQELPLWFFQFSLQKHRVREMVYPTAKLNEAEDLVQKLALVAQTTMKGQPTSIHQCIEIKKPSCERAQQAEQTEVSKPDCN
jgi:hypothetical protein